MTRKVLNTTSVINELKGQSIFFRREPTPQSTGIGSGPVAEATDKGKLTLKATENKTTKVTQKSTQTSDVSRDNSSDNSLKVVQSLQYVAGKGLLVLEPKTDKSRRMIVLPEFVVEALRQHLTKREKLSRSQNWHESSLVFTTDIGTAISPRNLLRHFKTKLEKAGLPQIRFHDLRHTTASLLLEKNVHPKIVSELLGHSSITLTLNTYSHIINPLSRVAADTLDGIVGHK